MTKKIIALCALLSINSFVCANGHPAQQGYQVSEGHHHGHSHHHEHHHHSKMSYADQKAIEGYDKEVEEIKKEGENPYWKSNACWTATAIGAIICILGTMDGKASTTTLVGGATVLFGGTIGAYTRSSEGAKVKEREQAIRDRHDRKDRILNKYR